MSARLAALFAVGVLGLVACTDSNEPDPADPTVSTTESTPETAPSPPPTSEAVAVQASASHPAGVTIAVSSLQVVPEGLLVEVTVDNASSEEAVLVNGIGQTYAVLDDGTVLDLQAPADNPELRVGADAELTGALAFAGDVPDDAVTVTIRFNYRGDRALNPSGGPGIVSLELADLPLTGDTAGPDDSSATGAVTVTERRTHPAGVELAVTRVRTDADGGIYLTVEVVNRSGQVTVLANNNSSTYLRDEQGRSYPLRAPADNPRLEVADGDRLDGEIAFVGPLDTTIERFTLHVNATPSTDRPLNADGGGGIVSFTVDALPAP